MPSKGPGHAKVRAAMEETVQSRERLGKHWEMHVFSMCPALHLVHHFREGDGQSDNAASQEEEPIVTIRLDTSHRRPRSHTQ